MKKCNNCGKLYSEESAFCPDCGSASATLPLNPGEQPGYAPPVQPYGQSGQPGPAYGGYQQPVQPSGQPQPGAYASGWQQPMGNQQPMGGQQPMGNQQPMGFQQPAAGRPQSPKKSNRGLIIGIIAVIVILLVILIAVSSNKNKDDDDTTAAAVTDTVTEEVTEEEENEPSVAFTKGEVKDGYYYNEWADVQFPIPEDYPEAQQDVYEDLESAMIKYGYIGDKSDNSRIMVEFVLNYALSFTSKTDEGLLQELMDELDEGDSFDAYEKGSIHTKMIGGKQYTGVVYTLPDTGYAMTIYLRSIGKHIFMLWTIGATEDADAFYGSVTGYTG